MIDNKAIVTEGALIMGPPGAGKSTLVTAIRTLLPEISHFSVRLYFTTCVRESSAIGLEASPYIKAGQWLPDELVCRAMQTVFEDTMDKLSPYIIEGYPATKGQLHWFNDFMNNNKLKPKIVYVDAPDSVCLSRTRCRKRCINCGRDIMGQYEGNNCPHCRGNIELRRDDQLDFFLDRLQKHRRLHTEMDIRAKADLLLDSIDAPDMLLRKALDFLKWDATK